MSPDSFWVDHIHIKMYEIKSIILMKSVWKMESTLIPNFSLQFRVVNDQGLVIKRRGAIFRIPHLFINVYKIIASYWITSRHCYNKQRLHAKKDVFTENHLSLMLYVRDIQRLMRPFPNLLLWFCFIQIL